MLFFRVGCLVSCLNDVGSTLVLPRMVGKWVGADNTIECDGKTTAREKRKVDKFAFCAKYIWEFLSKVFRLGAGWGGWNGQEVKSTATANIMSNENFLCFHQKSKANQGCVQVQVFLDYFSLSHSLFRRSAIFHFNINYYHNYFAGCWATQRTWCTKQPTTLQAYMNGPRRNFVFDDGNSRCSA